MSDPTGDGKQNLDPDKDQVQDQVSGSDFGDPTAPVWVDPTATVPVPPTPPGEAYPYGQQPAADVVKGISHLVASSVEGLVSDHVTVVDDGGRLLSEADEPTSAEGISNKQLQLQRDVEE